MVSSNWIRLRRRRQPPGPPGIRVTVGGNVVLVCGYLTSNLPALSSEEPMEVRAASPGPGGDTEAGHWSQRTYDGGGGKCGDNKQGRMWKLSFQDR